MTPSEWPLRFVPRRPPPLWRAALITRPGRPLLTKPYPAEALAAVIDAVMGKTPEVA